MIARCENHAGEPYGNRCEACHDAEQQRLDLLPTVRYDLNRECELHRYYPTPCDLCRRIRTDSL